MLWLVKIVELVVVLVEVPLVVVAVVVSLLISYYHNTLNSLYNLTYVVLLPMDFRRTLVVHSPYKIRDILVLESMSHQRLEKKINI